MSAKVDNLIEEINDLSPDDREELLAAFPFVEDELEPTKTILLAEPIKYGAREEFSEIHLKEPNGQQILAATKKSENNGGANSMGLVLQQELIALNAGLTAREVELIPFSKLMEAFNYLQGFMQGGRRTYRK